MSTEDTGARYGVVAKLTMAGAGHWRMERVTFERIASGSLVLAGVGDRRPQADAREVVSAGERRPAAARGSRPAVSGGSGPQICRGTSPVLGHDAGASRRVVQPGTALTRPAPAHWPAPGDLVARRWRAVCRSTWPLCGSATSSRGKLLIASQSRSSRLRESREHGDWG